MCENYPSLSNPRKLRASRKTSVYNCVEITKDMADFNHNYPPEPEKKHLADSVNQDAMYKHKPYCPLYKHKDTCPAIALLNDTNHKGHKKEDHEDQIETLSTSLPPIKLGPCPVMGRPCTKPNGFAKLLKNSELPPLPPSYSDAGKICCSKELERIKKVLKEFTSIKKDDDFRCVNKFFHDTDGRCCDDEQIKCALKGENCCGLHKLDLKTRQI